MSLISIIALACILIFFVLCWFALSYLLTPRMNNADAAARITGNCGDTMEIGLQLRDGRVMRTHHWTDGCTTSRHCVEAAARLAYGKSPEELMRVNMSHIIDDLGSLPDSHLHCAQLAETVLHAAVNDFSARQAESG